MAKYCIYKCKMCGTIIKSTEPSQENDKIQNIIQHKCDGIFEQQNGKYIHVGDKFGFAELIGFADLKEDIVE